MKLVGHIGPNIWMEFATIGEPYLVEGTTPGYPPPFRAQSDDLFFFMEHIHMLPNMPTHLPHNQQLSISPYSGFPFHVLLQTSCAPSESGFQETCFLFTPCHTTREDFLLFLLNLEKETLDFHGSNISLFVNYIWSHGP